MLPQIVFPDFYIKCKFVAENVGLKSKRGHAKKAAQKKKKLNFWGCALSKGPATMRLGKQLTKM